MSPSVWETLLCASSKVNVFEKTRMVVPVNQYNTHWAMMWLDLSARTINYANSLGGKGQR